MGVWGGGKGTHQVTRNEDRVKTRGGGGRGGKGTHWVMRNEDRVKRNWGEGAEARVHIG